MVSKMTCTVAINFAQFNPPHNTLITDTMYSFTQLKTQGPWNSANHLVSGSSTAKNCHLRSGWQGGEYSANWWQIDLQNSNSRGHSVRNLRPLLRRYGQGCPVHFWNCRWTRMSRGQFHFPLFFGNRKCTRVILRGLQVYWVIWRHIPV